MRPVNDDIVSLSSMRQQAETDWRFISEMESIVRDLGLARLVYSQAQHRALHRLNHMLREQEITDAVHGMRPQPPPVPPVDAYGHGYGQPPNTWGRTG